MIHTTRYVAELSAAHSQCICEISDELPCWRHYTNAFEVVWFAKWDKPPVVCTDDSPPYAMARTTWSVLTPSPALYPRTIRYRHLLQTPDTVTYGAITGRWETAGADVVIKGEGSEGLDALLRKHGQLITLRDSDAVREQGQIKWL